MPEIEHDGERNYAEKMIEETLSKVFSEKTREIVQAKIESIVPEIATQVNAEKRKEWLKADGIESNEAPGDSPCANEANVIECLQKMQHKVGPGGTQQVKNQTNHSSFDHSESVPVQPEKEETVN